MFYDSLSSLVAYPGYQRVKREIHVCTAKTEFTSKARLFDICIWINLDDSL